VIVPGVEVGDIFRAYGLAYRATHKLSSCQRRAMKAIEQCRTSALGGHIDECDECGSMQVSYNSCRNRHCPKCGALAKAKWLAAREKELLPVPYFHIVFTIPDSLNGLALRNQRVVYGILFRAASETLLHLGRDPKHLGGQIGVIAVLHTWGQNLMDHPHLHCIVTGGGLSEDAQRWLHPKKSGRKKFFIHVKVLSELFKKKFLCYLRESYAQGELCFSGEFQPLINDLYDADWVVYCKRPFGGSRQVLQYLGRYTHRVAISNDRILKMDDGQVTYRWRDYRDNQLKEMKVEAFEFIRRFLLHILPPNFCKIRYYGILSTRNKNEKLNRCRELLGVRSTSDSSTPKSWEELLLELTGIDVRVCRRCGKGRMIVREWIDPVCHSPLCHSPPQMVIAA
jgi:hypothetical protein